MVSRKEVERSADCYMTLASLPDECCCHLDRHVTFTTDEKYEKLILCVPPIIYSHAIGSVWLYYRPHYGPQVESHSQESSH